ncbi:LIN1-like protein [Mya arenaria]|uniref:LIN1-like protein n=1 Tax=Mya arenaria TaxID=6604 RepID=A0ABY7FPJ2_MYAAR|nr:LIN1-like protein [Mya arenaria]
MNRLKTAWCADDRPRQTLCMSYVNYKTDKRQFRRLHRNSVNQYLVKLDQEIDRKAEEDSKGFWCLVKRRRNTKKNLVGAGLNFDGSVVRDQSVITGKWAEYFQELYTPMTDERFDNAWKETAETEVSNVNPECVSNAIAVAPTGKAAGDDRIQHEHLKCAKEVLSPILANLFTQMLRQGYIPASMKRGIIITLHKGGKTREDNPDNYRAVTLISIFLSYSSTFCWLVHVITFCVT